MVAKHAGRRTRRQRKIRKNLRAKRGPCWLCGQPIDYALKYPDPGSFAPDHVYTVRDHPELAEDPANQRPSHKLCNEKRGAGAPPASLGLTSEDW